MGFSFPFLFWRIRSLPFLSFCPPTLSAFSLCKLVLCLSFFPSFLLLLLSDLVVYYQLPVSAAVAISTSLATAFSARASSAHPVKKRSKTSIAGSNDVFWKFFTTRPPALHQCFSSRFVWQQASVHSSMLTTTLCNAHAIFDTTNVIFGATYTG